MDTVSKKARSVIMSRIRGKNSKLEIAVYDALRRKEFQYKRHVKRLPGTPDIAFLKNRVVVFIDSCFWHMCRYHGTMPKTNRLFWRNKLRDNKSRDITIDRAYRKMGWRSIHIWEHQVKKDISKVVSRIGKTLALCPEVKD